jgi:hypothetical protein
MLGERTTDNRESSSKKKWRRSLRGLKEQASQIQKVSAQLAAASPSLGGLELSKFAVGRIRSRRESEVGAG